MNSAAIGFVLLYRRVFYPIYRTFGLHKLCRQEPSCSHFAEELFRGRQHGFQKSVVLTAARINRCKNGTQIGYHAVPEAPYVLSSQDKRDGAALLSIMACITLISGWTTYRLLGRTRR